MTHHRVSEEFLLGRIEAFDAEQKNIRLTHELRLAPEAHKFGRTFSDDVSDDHSVNAAGRRGGGGVQIGVAIHPEKIDMPVVAARAGEEADDLRAIPAENEDERA